MAVEVAPFGIRVLVVEPGAFRTALAGAARWKARSSAQTTRPSGASRRIIKGVDGVQPGDPAKAAAAILAALDAEQVPLRLPLGDDAVDSILGHLDSVKTQLHAWKHLSRTTSYDKVSAPTGPGS